MENDLKEIGIKIYQGEDLEILKEMDAVLISSAVKETNLILKKAHELGKMILTRHDIWNLWSEKRNIIAVAGCHGKTTTTGMLDSIINPITPGNGAMIGVPGKRSAIWGLEKDYFILEADEYAKTFLALKPKISLILNIDRDHVDIYPSDQDYFSAFLKFAENTIISGGSIVACGDDTNIWKLLKPLQNSGMPIIFYGFDGRNDYLINIESGEIGNKFYLKGLMDGDRKGILVTLSVFGNHNILNAAGAILAGREAGFDIEILSKNMLEFKGMERRQEFMGNLKISNNLVPVYDDYAHAPAEVLATINAFKKQFPDNRLVCYFQPHTYSRITEFWDQYLIAFENCDVIGVGDVFGSRENDLNLKDQFTIQKLLGEIKPSKTIQNQIKIELGGTDVAGRNILVILKPGDILIALNAGTGREVIQKILSENV